MAKYNSETDRIEVGPFSIDPDVFAEARAERAAAILGVSLRDYRQLAPDTTQEAWYQADKELSDPGVWLEGMDGVELLAE